MLGNCLALMVKWSIEAAGPIYHADTMHGWQGRPQQLAHNDTHTYNYTHDAKILPEISLFVCVATISENSMSFLLPTSCAGGGRRKAWLWESFAEKS